MTYVGEDEDSGPSRRIRDQVMVILRRPEMGKVVLENDIGAASEFVEYPLRLPFGDVRIIP